MKDLIVVIPGILGSVLERDGKQIWGLSGQAFVSNFFSLGRNIKALELPSGIGHDDPKDGIVASRLMPSLHMLPGFWKIDGYTELIRFLERKFTLTRPSPEQAGNLIEFPYDWRLSNVLSARKLSETVVPELERWRKHTNNPDAKLILICHSMGGLVARWFLELLGGRDLTRMLVTIGTPYQGAVNALSTLVNGFSVGIGLLSANFDQLVRSLPSAYQLLPTYKCLDVGNGELQELSGTSLPNLGDRSIREGLTFHQKVSVSIARTSPYKTFVIKGIVQPTAQSALLAQGKISSQRHYGGVDVGGDGTVPRPSSHPPEWTDEAGSIFAAQAHSALQNTDGILTQLFGLLTGHLGTWMGGVKIGLDVPDLVLVSEPMRITAISEDGDPTLPLNAVCHREDGILCAGPVLMRSRGEGEYGATFENLAPGAYRITVESAAPERPVDAVTDLSLVWDPSEKE